MASGCRLILLHSDLASEVNPPGAVNDTELDEFSRVGSESVPDYVPDDWTS